MAKESGLGDRLLIGGYDLSGDIGTHRQLEGLPIDLESSSLAGHVSSLPHPEVEAGQYDLGSDSGRVGRIGTGAACSGTAPMGRSAR